MESWNINYFNPPISLKDILCYKAIQSIKIIVMDIQDIIHRLSVLRANTKQYTMNLVTNIHPIERC